MRKDVLNVQSVGKALSVLQCFGVDGESEKDLSLMDIVRLTGYDKSTAQRFTHTLHVAGYLAKNPHTKRYSLGVQVLELAFNFLRNNSFIEMANPHLIDLCRLTGERVSLSLFDDTSLIYAMRHQTRPDYYFSSLVGRRVPTFCTAGGRSILFCLGKAEAADILNRSSLLPFTAKTIIDREQLLKEIEKAGEMGYGVTAEEINYGEVGIGAAILDKVGKPIAAIHLIGSIAEWTPDGFEAKYASLLLETVQRISRR